MNGSRVGDPLSGGEGVQCHTDLTTCCSRHQGNYSGNWYAPNGDQLAFYSQSSGDHINTTFQRHESQKVTLYHRSRVFPSDHQTGMFRCDIAVNGSGRGTVYIRIYVVLRGWIKSAARYYISDIYALRRYYINFLSGENGQMKQLGIFCGGYYRVDDINYLCHVRYGMFPRNKSLALVIYCGNIPNGRDITNTYETGGTDIIWSC